MIGVDTNILLRYIMQDDEAQSPRATALIESLDTENPAFISLVTLAEFYWVLDHTYKLSPARIAELLEGLLRSKTVVLENEQLWHFSLSV